MATCTAAAALREVDSLKPACLLSGLRSINHISMVCSNLEASVAFYRDVLGFIVVKRPQSFNETFEGCWLWRYGLGLHLIVGTPVPRSPHIDPRSDHLSFQADSLEEVQATLQACGMPFVRQEVFEDGVHVSQLFVRDPDGYTIEICNCDCLPIVPLDVAQQMCQLGAAQAHSEDEAMSPHMLCTRGSMDSERSLL